MVMREMLGEAALNRSTTPPIGKQTFLLHRRQVLFDSLTSKPSRAWCDGIGMDVLKQLQADLASFAAERDWEQFHTPKNLAMALSGETGELLELFQWLTPEQSERAVLSDEAAQAVEEEMADVLLYLLRLADRLQVDIAAAAQAKIKRNAEKYPIEKSKGNATKYSRREK
jgi:dCTP diphosphatase